MNQDIKKQWVLDLTDGTREQGHGYLRDKDGRQCCLDVLCEQAVRAGVISEPTLQHKDGPEDSSGRALVYSYRDSSGNVDLHYLPRAVAEWAGLKDEEVDLSVNPAVWWRGEKKYLADVNDAEYGTFEEIAQAIDNSL